MRITIPKDGKSGTAEIPKGEYWVSLHADTQQIFLSGNGRDIKLAATRRKANSRGKTISVIFSCGGGIHWSLIVSAPKYGEWIAMLELGGKDRDRDERHRPR